MRVASRHMPKIPRRPIGLVGWLLIACLLVGAAYFAATETQAFLITLSILAALFWLSRKKIKHGECRLLALASQREGQTIREFAQDFDARAVDTWIIRAVYEQLQGQLKYVHPSFPVRADDTCRLQFNSRSNININQRLIKSLATPDSKPFAT